MMILWILIVAAPFVYVAYESYRQVRRDAELDQRVAETYRDAA